MAFIPALIGVATSVISGISAAKKRKQQEQQQNQLVTQQQSLIDEQKKGAQLAFGEAQKLLPQGYETLSGVKDYWKNIFTGDRNALNTFLAPEVNAYNRSLDQGISSLFRTGPRGSVGDRAVDAQFKRAGDMSSLFFGAKRESANKLQDLGSIFANAGLSALGSASGTNASAANSLAGLSSLAFGREQQYGRQAGEAFSSAGQGVGQLLSLIKGNKEAGGGFKSLFSFLPGSK